MDGRGSVAEHRNAEALLREFLLFRGFTHTLRAFEAELASDVTQGYQVDKIMQLVFDHYVPKYEIDKLVELMEFLGRTLFSPADAQCQATARKLGTAVRKYYLVNAVQKGRVDRVLHLFQQYGDSLLYSGEDWQAWFALPYLKNASADPRFQVYFTKEWLDTLTVSFRNFLCLFFDNIRFPALMKLMSKRLNYREVKHELKECQDECTSLRTALQAKDDEIVQLRATLTSLRNELSNSLKSKVQMDDSDFSLTVEKALTEGSASSSASLDVHSKGQEAQPISIATETIDDAVWPNEEDFSDVTVASQVGGKTSQVIQVP